MPWWWDVRNVINNQLIRFLLNHCVIDCCTLHKIVHKVSNYELQAIMDEKEKEFEE